MKDLLTLHKLADKVSLTIKADDLTGGRGDMDPSDSVANGFRKIKGKTIFRFFYFKETLPFSSLHYYQVPYTVI